MDFIEDDILITFSEASTNEERFTLCRRYRIIPMRGIGEINLWLTKVEPSERDATIASLQCEPIVERAALNLVISAPEMVVNTPTDPYYQQQWHLQLLEIEKAWAMLPETLPTPILIAHVDTGVKSSHPDLVGRIAPGGWNSVNNSSNTEDIDNHGTATAGTIVANADGAGCVGINPRAKIIPFIGFGGTGTGTIYTIADALTRAGNSGADIITMSFGVGTTMPAEINTALNVGIANGCVLVGSAGNEATRGSHYPSSKVGVISVGSTSKDDGWGYYYSKSNYGMEVDFAAPGEMIWAPYVDGTQRAFSGTSLACPIGSGVASLVLEKIGSRVPWQDMQMLLQASCEHMDIGGNTDRIFFRSGRISPVRALENATRYMAATAPEVTITYPKDNSLVTLGTSLKIDFTVFGDSPIVEAKFYDGGMLRATVANPTKPYLLYSSLLSAYDGGFLGTHTLTVTVTDSQGRTASHSVTVRAVSNLDTTTFQTFWAFTSAPALATSGFVDFDLLIKGYDGSTINQNVRVVSLEQVGDVEHAIKTETERMKGHLLPYKISPAAAFENVNWCLPNEQVQSNTITLSDIDIPVHCNILGSGEIRLNSGGWSKGPLTASPNDTLVVRNTSSATNEGTALTTAVIGGITRTFTLTTANGLPPTNIAVAAGSGRLTLTWTKSTGATKYEIKYGTTPAMTDSTGWLGDVSSCVIEGLQDGTMYYLAVRAGNVDRVSAYSSTYTQMPVGWDADTSGWSMGTGTAVSTAQAYEGVTSFKFFGTTDSENGIGVSATITHNDFSLYGKTKIALRYKDLTNPGAVSVRLFYYNVSGQSVVVTKANIYYSDGLWHLLEFTLPQAQGTNKTVQINVLNYDYDGDYLAYIDKVEAI